MLSNKQLEKHILFDLNNPDKLKHLTRLRFKPSTPEFQATTDPNEP